MASISHDFSTPGEPRCTIKFDTAEAADKFWETNGLEETQLFENHVRVDSRTIVFNYKLEVIR